jgi:hypothetical protein
VARFGLTLKRLRKLRVLLAWFAGTDLRVLALNPSEWVFYNALGLTVVLLACGSGVGAAVAVGYMLQTSAVKLWWVGIGWAVVVACGIERLVLQVTASGKKALLAALVPRVALALLLAVQFGEPAMLAINRGAIDNRISAVRTVAVRKASRDASRAHASAIAAATRAIASLERQQTALTNQIEYFQFKSACEANTPSCSHTHQLTCRAWCHHFANRAAIARRRLVALRPGGRIAALRTEIASERASARAEARARAKTIRQDDGLIAREEALVAIEKAHPIVRAETWFLRIFFLVLDLLPLTLKVVRMLAVYSPYEAAMTATRRRDGLRAKREDERSRVEEERIGEQGRADGEFMRIRISLENEQRIAAAEARATAAGFAPRNRAEGARVHAYSLGELVEKARPHELERIRVDPRLARAGRLGTVFVGALTVVTGVFRLFENTTVSGDWLIYGAAGAVAALALYTNWYSTAPRWALRPILATLLVGLTLPIAITVLNV